MDSDDESLGILGSHNASRHLSAHHIPSPFLAYLPVNYLDGIRFLLQGVDVPMHSGLAFHTNFLASLIVEWLSCPKQLSNIFINDCWLNGLIESASSYPH